MLTLLPGKGDLDGVVAKHEAVGIPQESHRVRGSYVRITLLQCKGDCESVVAKLAFAPNRISN